MPEEHAASFASGFSKVSAVFPLFLLVFVDRVDLLLSLEIWLLDDIIIFFFYIEEM